MTPNQGHELFSFIPNINLFRYFIVTVFRAGTMSLGNNLEWLPKFHRIPVLSQQKMNNWRFAKKLHVLANPENALIVVGTVN